MVRKVEPWSVLKFSLLFYFCLMLVFLFAMLILYWLLGLMGVLEATSKLLHESGFGPAKGTFRINGFWIFSRMFMLGIAGVVVWSIVNVFVALIYNVVSDLVGGIQVTLSERR